jgi:hypothetical protein
MVAGPAACVRRLLAQQDRVLARGAGVEGEADLATLAQLAATGHVRDAVGVSHADRHHGVVPKPAPPPRPGTGNSGRPRAS